MSPRILIIGGNGQLGRDVVQVGREQNREMVALTHSEIDITRAESVDETLSEFAPHVVVNTAAAHSANQSTAAEQVAFYTVNALGAWHLARWCRRNDAAFVHYSTDYVFGAENKRDKPYSETDEPCPTNNYGASKLAGEKLVQTFCPRHYVLRVASVYGAGGCRAKNNSNFVLMTLGKIRAGQNMQVVNDQWMSPTWTRSAALKTFELLDANSPYGLYHLAGSGACSWFELACEVVKLTSGAISVEPTITPPDKPGDIFLRPRYTALDNANLRRTGLKDMPDWREALKIFLDTQTTQ
jgi:dTDP-4-dehydrorhamnose reductase